jgi:hypothetical protein
MRNSNISVIEQEFTLKKAKYHHPSKEEKEILETLFAFDATPPDATRLKIHGVMKKEKENRRRTRYKNK